MSSPNASTWQTYLRLLKFARPYWVRLCLGIVSGLLVGSSVLGVLGGLSGVADSYQQPKQAAPQNSVPNAQDLQGTASTTAAPPPASRHPLAPAITPDMKPETALEIEKMEDYLAKLRDLSPGTEDWLRHNMNLYDPITKRPSGGILMLSILAMGLFMMLRSMMTYINRMAMRWVGSRVVADLRNRLFDKLTHQSLAFHGRMDIGTLMARCTNDCTEVQKVVADSLSQITTCPAIILSVFSFMIYFAINEQLYGLLAFVLIGIPMIMFPIHYLGKKIKKQARKSYDRVADVFGRMQETFTCIRAVKASHMEKHEAELFRTENDRHFHSVLKVLKYDILMSPLMEAICVLFACVIVLYCHMSGKSILILAPIGIAANFAYGPLKQLTKLQADIQRASAAAARIFDYLDLKEDLPLPPQPVELKKVSSSIVFKDVQFSFGEQPLIQDLSIDIKAGSYTAFVGEAGSGKSTIVNLLARFHDVKAGSITLDGVDLRHIDPSCLYALIGFVDQTTMLFNQSIRYNIAYGSPHATQADIERAARLAEADGFIREKPQGYDYIVGEKGSRLSGGQRQRIAIARALLRDPAILILDEATSALDNETEALVQKALQTLMQGRTTIAIAHRLSTIRQADTIHLLDKGRVIESGTHDELLARHGRYERLWNIQFREELPPAGVPAPP